MFVSYAQAAEEAKETLQELPESTMESFSDILVRFVPMLLIFMVFYFLILRPQSKKRQEHEDLVKSVKKGQEILTYSGMYGKVMTIAEETLEIEIAPKVSIKIDKSSIQQVITK